MKVKKFFSAPFLFFLLSLASIAFSAEKSVIKIESAQKSEYKKDEENGSDTIVLTGDVKVSVTSGSKTTTIKADKINYNRGNDMIYAEGNVELDQSSGGTSGGETVTADSLLFNTVTLEGIFDNGRAVQTSSDALNLPSGSKLIVASEMFGRDSGGTIAFKSGNLTFCDDEDPHWRIKASRIWLLPGGEFAFLNAVLYVGRVPLLWLPAFYYPKDELIFNPSFGYKSRTGYFFNTTTYLYGRKSADSSSTSSDDDDDKINFFSLMNTSSMKEQVREGLVLHNLDEDFKGDTSHYVKIMADYYENLGIMTGIDANVVPGSYLTSLVANLELGFSNTVFKNNSVYTPFNALGDKVSDSSNFMGFDAPFRYQANLKMTFAKPFTLNISIPIYSDPYFDYDFNNRAESMDWIGYAMNGGKTSEDDDEDVTEISSFTWNLNGSYKIPLPAAVSPYVSSLSVSSFSSSVAYSSKAATLTDRDEYADDSAWATYTPARKFYYPSQVNPFKSTLSISGTIFKYPADSSSSKAKSAASLVKIDEFKTEEELLKEKEEAEKKAEEARLASLTPEQRKAEEEKKKGEKSDGESESKVVFDESVLPSLSVSVPSVKSVGDLTYTLGYTVTPDFTSQFSYSSTALETPEDFSWSDMQSTYINVKSPATLSSTLGYKGGFFSLTDSLTFSPVYQRHPYLKSAEVDENGNESTSNGGYTEASKLSIKKTDYNARKLDLSSTNTATIKPFYYTDHFSGTSLAWNSTMKLVDTEFLSDEYTSDDDDPEWEYHVFDFWDKDEFTTHSLTGTFAASELDGKLTQSLALTSTLPPRYKSYTGTLTLGFPCVTLTTSGGIKENETEQTESNADSWEKWIKQDFSESLSVSLFDSKLKISQSYAFDFEKWDHESFKASVSGYGAQLSYVASYVSGYYFNVATDDDGNVISRRGWKANSSDEKKFQPYSMTLSYTKPSATYKYWSDRVSFAPTLTTSVVYDFLRPTSSYFSFKPGLTFKINNFLDVSFSAETKNSVIYRYFCTAENYEYYYAGKGERSWFKDLLDSFRFDDKEKRESSAFKMKTVSLSVTHDLDDWDLNFSMSVSPTLISETDGTKSYDFSPEISLSIAWRPLSSMKTELKYELDDTTKESVWELNPSD